MTRPLFLLLTLLASPAVADVQVAFSPGNATAAVVGFIQSAQQAVHVAAYSFTSRPSAEALLDAHRRDVAVAAVLDKAIDTARPSEAGEMVQAGVPVRIDGSYALRHDQFVVVDGVTVETSSFNCTAAAERSNAENVIVLRDYPDVAARYEAEWERLGAKSDAYLRSLGL